MTKEEAIKKLKGALSLMWQTNILVDDINEYKEAMNVAIEALEKQMPKKPKCYEDKYMCCSKCNEFLCYKWEEYPVKTNKAVFGELKYCHECGQAIDFSEV